MAIRYERVADHVVTITIDRPEVRNALDLPHFQALADAWRRFRDDADAWVAVLTGVGRSGRDRSRAAQTGSEPARP